MQPIVKPIKTVEYTVEQSKYNNIGKLPTRTMLVAPSGGGKTTLLASMILDFYKGCFSRVYIFSPSIHIDAAWKPVINYLKKELHQDDKKEKFLFDNYDNAELEYIIDMQFRIVEWMKQNGRRKLYQILIIIDDWADTPAFTRNAKLLHTLYIRGRHLAISTITSTQVYKAIAPVIRKNITNIYIFRLRNASELEAILQEFSAIYNRETLIEMYNIATGKPHGFLYIDLSAHDKENMFFDSLTTKLIPKINNIDGNHNHKTK